MPQHKVKISKSLTKSLTVEADCTCGWYESENEFNAMSKSMRKIRQELQYKVNDHLDESKEVANA